MRRTDSLWVETAVVLGIFAVGNILFVGSRLAAAAAGCGLHPFEMGTTAWGQRLDRRAARQVPGFSGRQMGAQSRQ